MLLVWLGGALSSGGCGSAELWKGLYQELRGEMIEGIKQIVVVAADGKRRVAIYVTYICSLGFLSYIFNWHVCNHNYCGAGGGWGIATS